MKQILDRFIISAIFSTDANKVLSVGRNNSDIDAGNTSEIMQRSNKFPRYIGIYIYKQTIHTHTLHTPARSRARLFVNW